jgi:multiple sugar transport system ATP-binding protein
MAEIVFEHIEKRFVSKGQSVLAVADLSLTVEDGEFLVLVGPSGCGKTTALRIVAGLEAPTAGALFIGGRQVTDVPPKDRDIAMVFQNYALYPHMTVYDNLAFGLQMRRVPKTEIAQLIADAAEMLDIAALLKRKPKELSGGQRQRVALGRAIVRHPQAFLMDEPLSNLDAQLRVQTRAELIKLHGRLGVTTLYVTHDQTEAMTMGSRIAVMNAGVLQQLDTPQQLYDAPVNRFVAGFIGSPAMNFLEGTVAQTPEGWVVVVEGVALPIPARLIAKAAGYRDQPVTLGLRPEAITQPGEAGRLALALPVEVVEPLGSDVYVTLRLGRQPLTGRFAPRHLPRPGTDEPVAFNLEAAHLFDPATGAAL